MALRILVVAFIGCAGLLFSAAAALAGPGVPIEVPEPATLAVLAAGVGALALAKFRRRR